VADCLRSARAAHLLATLLVCSAAHADEPPPPAFTSTVHARPRRDRNTPELVITARELEQRGAQNLKDALDLIPEIQVRQGGMGTRFDLRGAKQRSVLILIDGVALDEPYQGAFEISSIPVTDIVEIRVQLAPASPLEGPGGDGGIVEVTTLRAIGSKRLVARAVGGTTPYAEGAVTGRTGLNESGTLGLRASAGAHFSDPGYPATSADGMTHSTFFDRDSQAYTALRLESQTDSGHYTGDVWYGHRSYYIPPTDTTGNLLLSIPNQDAARAVFGAEWYRRKYRIALGAYGEYLSQPTDYYADYTLTNKTLHVDVTSGKFGAAALLERPLFGHGVSAWVTGRLALDSEFAYIAPSNMKAVWGLTTFLTAAVGAKMKWRWLSLDGSVGMLLPFDNPAGTWPEAKLVIGFNPHKAVNILLIGARKGRLPTIREQYDPLQGNPNILPEQTWHGELQAQVRPHPLVFAHASVYVRQIDGFIRAATGSGTGIMAGHDENLDTIDVRGLEAAIDVARERIIGGGITWVFQDAYSKTLGFDAIPYLPHHRVDAYLSTSFWHHRMGGLLRFRWVAEHTVQNVVLPRYYVMDLNVWAKISQQIRTSLRIDNLTNNAYQQLPGLAALGTTATLTVEGVWE
jgi:outer membrane cobalamin receptor